MRHLSTYTPRWIAVAFLLLFWSGVASLLRGADTPMVVVNTTTGRQQQAQAADNALAAGGIKATGTTASTTSTTGTVIIGNGTAATTVGIGSGAIFTGGNVAVGNASDPFGRGLGRLITVDSVAAGGGSGLEINAASGQASEVDLGAAGTRYLAMSASSASAAVSAMSTAPLNFAAGGSTLMQMATGGTTHWFNTTDATGVGTAAIFTDGGLGVAKRSFLGTIGSTFKGDVLAGVQDGTAAVAGQVGEVLSAGQSTYTNFTTTATYQQLATIALTAGDWDVRCTVTFNDNTATLTANANAIAALSTTTASAAGTTEGRDIVYVSQTGVVGSTNRQTVTFTSPVSVAATTNYFLNAQATFTAGNPQYTCYMSARRQR